MDATDATDLAFAGIARQAQLVRDGDVTPRELVALCLERIGRLDPLLNAVRVTFPERALAEARQAAARRRGRRADLAETRPLLGVPVLIKDDTDVAGELTTYGTRAHGGPAQQDAEVVRRLRAAGAIVIGKTHTPELMQWPFTESVTFGATRNPWDLDRTPGGSSGGSGAAVAAGLAGAALADDGGGSIRIPAACCGLFGLKPQRDRIPETPKRDSWNGLSALGCVTRTVADTALWLDVTADRDRDDDESYRAAAGRSPGRLRIAYTARNPLLAPLAREQREAFEQTIELLRGLGHTLQRVDLPLTEPVVPQWVVRYLRGIAQDAAALPHPERLEPRTRAMARLGRAIPDGVLRWAREAEAATTIRLNAALADHAVLLTPALAALPLPIGRYQRRGALWTFNGVARFTPFTPIWNATGQPAAAVPAGATADGVPLSVQLVGRPRDEATLLSLAAQIEAARPWAARRPTLAV